MAQAAHVPGEPRDQVDLRGVGPQVDQHLAALAAADAGDVAQPAIGPVLLALDPPHVLAQRHQHLVQGVPQLADRIVGRLRLRHAPGVGRPRSRAAVAGRGGDDRLKAEQAGAEEAVADQVDTAADLTDRVPVVPGERSGCAPRRTWSAPVTCCASATPRRSGLLRMAVMGVGRTGRTHHRVRGCARCGRCGCRLMFGPAGGLHWMEFSCVVDGVGQAEGPFVVRTGRGGVYSMMLRKRVLPDGIFRVIKRQGPWQRWSAAPTRCRRLSPSPRQSFPSS